ncbi:putative ribonuclease H-like domain-containing protein [Tanacetum coccineum]
MTGNKCYLDEYEDYDGGFFSFGDGKGRISRKVLLRVPRKDNVYSVDLKSVVPTGGLTCLIAKATIYESNTWHRRIGHINFKTMNNLVKGNLVKGLPLKIFENDHSCVAYQKRKQHKAFYKTKLVNSISKPLHMLRMDLFGPTNVKSLMKKVLVIKPHNKTPYELVRGRPPLIDFMKPFGCPVTILNTKDHLGKFDGKADEGYFVGYYVVSKAMRVFNKRTRIIEETLNIIFLKNTPNVKGNGPDWLFDVDSLSVSRNYLPVAAGNKSNGIVGTKDNIVASQAQKEKEHEQEYILISLCTTDPLISQGPKDSKGDVGMKPTKVDENEVSDKSGKHDQEARSAPESTPVSTAVPSFDTVVPSTPVNVVGQSVSTANESEEQLFERFSPFKNAFTLPPVLNISSMDNTGIFGNAYDDEDVDEEVDMNNVISSYSVPDTSFTKFHKDHVEDQVIRIDLPRDKWAIGTKWVFRNKKDERGIVVKNKARLVAQGHTQEEDGCEECFLNGKIEEGASRPDIMFVVCACARFQVTPKISHLHVVKRIFRASLVRIPNRSFQFLGKRLISKARCSNKFETTLIYSNELPLSKVNDYLESGETVRKFLELKLGDMSHHKKTFVNPFHIKKIFANMMREGKDFSGRVTPLFDSMLVQASEEVGETKSRRKQRKEAEVANDETEQEENIPTPSNDPLPSGEDSMQLNESVSTPSNDPQPSGEDSMQLTDLMVLCTELQTLVLYLEKAKDAQANEIAALKKRIQKLERKKMSRPIDIDADVEVTLVDETQERQDDELMFDTGVLDTDEMPVEAKVDEKDEQSTKLDDSTAGEAVTTASVEDSAAPTTIEEITLAQTLIQIKAAKPKVVTTAATTTTTTRPKAKGVVV